MGIPLFNLMNNTPDRVRSLDASNSDTGREFTWCLRDKEKPGLNIKVLSIPTDSEDSNWEVRVHESKWEGNEFRESDEPISSYSHSNSEEALSCAEREVKSLCSQEKYEHCLDFLRS